MAKKRTEKIPIEIGTTTKEEIFKYIYNQYKTAPDQEAFIVALKDDNYSMERHMIVATMKYLYPNQKNIEETIEEWIVNIEKHLSKKVYSDAINRKVETCQEELGELLKCSTGDDIRNRLKDIVVEIMSIDRAVIEIDKGPMIERIPEKIYYPTTFLNVRVILASPSKFSTVMLFNGEQWLATLEFNEEYNKPWHLKMVDALHNTEERFYSTKESGIKTMVAEVVLNRFMNAVPFNFIEDIQEKVSNEKKKTENTTPTKEKETKIKEN